MKKISIMATLNDVRRSIMHRMTAGIGARSKPLTLAREEVRRILVSRPNARLGNQLLATPLVQELSMLFPHAQIDLFMRGGVAHTIFQNYACVKNIRTLPSKPFQHLLAYAGVWLRLRNVRYDLAVNAVSGSSSGRLSVKRARAKAKIYALPDTQLSYTYDDYSHIAKSAVYALRIGLGESVHEAARSVPNLDMRLSAGELAEGREILHRLVPSGKPTICLYTYATGTKCHDSVWWNELYDKLLAVCGSRLSLVEILPKENVSQIGFKATSYYSLELRQLAAVIAASAVFIGADSGMMHLASASGATVIGLFSVTDPHVYAPYGNGSIAVDTGCTTTDELARLTVDMAGKKL